jgi:phosphoserine phosphatase
MKTTIYLIRHGQTVWNVERRMQGQSDSPLTEKGIEMAQKLGECMPEVDVIYASPLARTMHTARLIFGAKSEIWRDNRLLEINLGAWEGRLQAKLDEEEPENHGYFWRSPDRFMCPGGESFQQVYHRSVSCLRDLASRHPGERLALVSHTIPIRSMLYSIEKRPLADFWLPPAIYPASLSELHYDEKGFQVVQLGMIDHYDEADRPTGAY